MTDSTAQSATPDDDAGQVAEICIAVMQDGRLQVYTEQGSDPNEAESQREDAADIGEALKLALQAYKRVSADSGGADQQFDAGFGGQGSARVQRGFR